MEAVFPLTRTYFLVNRSFRLVEASFLSAGNAIALLRVFSAIVEIRRKSIFKYEPYSCYWTPIYLIFFKFFTVKAAFIYCGKVFFNK